MGALPLNPYERYERVGERLYKPVKEPVYNACECCEKYVAEVKVLNMKLCGGCAEKEGITLL